MFEFLKGENWVMNILGRIGDMMLLNFCWLICCIPVVTIVPATIALYAMASRYIDKDYPYNIKEYFYQFKSNLKKGVQIELVIAIIGTLLWSNYYTVNEMQQFKGGFFQIAFWVVLVLFVGVLLYLFPLVAKYENTIWNSFKNSLILSIFNIQYTFLMLLTVVFLVGTTVWNEYTMFYGILAWVMVLGALLAVINSYIMRFVFRKIDKILGN